MVRSALLLATIATAALLAAPLPAPRPKKDVGPARPRDADELLALLAKGSKPVEIDGGWLVTADRVEGRVLHNAVFTRKAGDGRAEARFKAREAEVGPSRARGGLEVQLRFGHYIQADGEGYFVEKFWKMPFAPKR
jgi:hypothetical protein